MKSLPKTAMGSGPVLPLITMRVRFPSGTKGSSTPIRRCLIGRLVLKTNTSILNCVTVEGACADDSMDADIKTAAQTTD